MQSGLSFVTAGFYQLINRFQSIFSRLMLVGLLLVPLNCMADNSKSNTLAIVVHPDTNIEGLTQAQVTRIFRSEQQFWKNKTRITLLIRAPISSERSVVLEKIYHMSESEFRKYWIGKMFKAEVASGPKIVYTTDMAINLINAIPGAITFVPFAKIPEGVKVLKIDGKFPGDPGYPWIL